ncbi:M23 family metallopeptidase [Sphingomonas sp. HHU CXW]|uniref:M23 family metallopeptidase n=1 Tax=Sphingomonas hominis TaxID=2741495 RepID=A0ABX2JNU0_9SPHN|nr:M23 family metallopeptidase [Sphingomonas hominis]NTS66134.1 M23 family metallopeptidase [Sphingomonas hominis]
MFLREQQGLELAGAAGSSVRMRALVPAAATPSVPLAEPSLLDRVRDVAVHTDWAPDLGQDIGSRTWWRGAATCAALIAAAWMTRPGFPPILGYAPPVATGAAYEETRTQGIAPLALGSTTGRRAAASGLVRRLSQTPERPQIDLTVTLGGGDTLSNALQRAGVGMNEAARVATLVGGAVSLDQLKPGTILSLTMGRRPSRLQPRPLEKLSFRAGFDLDLAVNRAGNDLLLDRRPISIDRAPLHVRGLVGASLYRSMRAAGVPARVVESYIKAVAARMPIGDVGAADTFDIVADQARAATGEVEVGQLQYAGLADAAGRRRLQLVRWGDQQGEGGSFMDPTGQVERRGFMGMPVAGRVTSTFGMRMHPLLGFMRMHRGMDIGAPYGSPIYAAIDGVVSFAGRSGGYGNFIKLAHPGGYASGYGHLSRFAVSTGTRVARGQVIGYVGSTGMSTGPHLHWEVWKNGVPVNPRSISLSSVQTVSGDTLRGLKAKIARLLSAPAR